MNWTDSSGRSLADYPRPSLAVDVALFTVSSERGLAVLLHRRDGSYADGAWSLPGTFVRDRERLLEAVRRAVTGKLGLRTRAPEQLGVFDEPGRDDRGHVVSVAHVDLLAEDDLAPGTWAAAPVNGVRALLPDGQRALPFDHDRIVQVAVERLRLRHREQPDPYGLLGDTFTLLRLRRLHEAVAGRRIDKDNFRRHMTRHLVETDLRSSGSRGKPAMLFRRA